MTAATDDLEIGSILFAKSVSWNRRVHKHLLLFGLFWSGKHNSEPEATHRLLSWVLLVASEDVSLVGGLSTWPRTHSLVECWNKVAITLSAYDQVWTGPIFCLQSAVRVSWLHLEKRGGLRKGFIPCPPTSVFPSDAEQPVVSQSLSQVRDGLQYRLELSTYIW